MLVCFCGESDCDGGGWSATKCGHIFHQLCIVQWLERSNTCPQCRSSLGFGEILRVYPTQSTEIARLADETLKERLEATQRSLEEAKEECRQRDSIIRNLTETNSVQRTTNQRNNTPILQNQNTGPVQLSFGARRRDCNIHICSAPFG